MNSSLPFAHRVTWERINRDTGRIEIMRSGIKGSHSHARANAIIKPNFMKIVSVEPLTAEQFEREFPKETHGRTGRFVCLRA